MRQIADGLDDPLEQHAPDLIKHQRQQDRSRKPDTQLQQANYYRVTHYRPEVGRIEEGLKMLQPYPWTMKKTAEQLIILERHQYPIHGQIAEDEDKQHCGYNHQLNIPLPDPPAPPGYWLSFRPGNDLSFDFHVSHPSCFCALHLNLIQIRKEAPVPWPTKCVVQQ